MLRSLRFRLPALFLLGILVSGLIAAIVALRLFQGYVLQRSKSELRREAIGLTEVFATQAISANDTGQGSPDRAAARAGDRLTSCSTSASTRCPTATSPRAPAPDGGGLAVRADDHVRVRPPGRKQTYLAVARPLRLNKRGPAFGDLIVATPKTELTKQWVPLLERLALASLGGILVAGLLGWYCRGASPGRSWRCRGHDRSPRGDDVDSLRCPRGGGEIGELARAPPGKMAALTGRRPSSRSATSDQVRLERARQRPARRRSAGTSRRCARASPTTLTGLCARPPST